jgi:hypothetical protein
LQTIDEERFSIVQIVLRRMIRSEVAKRGVAGSLTADPIAPR